MRPHRRGVGGDVHTYAMVIILLRKLARRLHSIRDKARLTTKAVTCACA